MKTPINRIALFITTLFWCLNGYTQAPDPGVQSKVLFCSKNELGGLIGLGQIKGPDDFLIRNPEWAWEVTSTNGIHYKSWFVGAGVGVRMWGTDVTVPLFGQVSLDLWKTGLFLHADLGYQFGGRKVNHYGDKETGGLYAAYGLGYQLAVREQKLYVKASMCHQNSRASGKSNGLGPVNYLEDYTLNYLFLRISVGLQLHAGKR